MTNKNDNALIKDDDSLVHLLMDIEFIIRVCKPEIEKTMQEVEKIRVNHIESTINKLITKLLNKDPLRGLNRWIYIKNKVVEELKND